MRREEITLQYWAKEPDDFKSVLELGRKVASSVEQINSRRASLEVDLQSAQMIGKIMPREEGFSVFIRETKPGTLRTVLNDLIGTAGVPSFVSTGIFGKGEQIVNEILQSRGKKLQRRLLGWGVGKHVVDS